MHCWYVAFYGVLGAAIGSFVTLCSHRIFDASNSIISGFSSCPSCKHRIHWKSLIPIMSFFIQKGKCLHCKKRISWRYPLIELAQALLFVTIYMRFGNVVFSYLLMVFSVAMLIHIVTDIEHQMISAVINYFAIIVAIIINLVNKSYLIGAIITSLSIAVAFWLLGFIVSRFLKKPALGFGDVEIVAALALLLQHPIEFIPIMAIAGTLGIVFHCVIAKMKNHANDISIPFAPPLIVAFFIEILFLRQKVLQYLLPVMVI